jgi:MFS family permease
MGGLLLQYPIGWVSDRMDRRVLILIVAAAGGVGGLIGAVAGGYYPLYLVAGFVIGGLSNPLYALLLAYANDYMAREDMPAASGGFLFINGIGAIFGPIITGWIMGIGSWGYFLFIGVLMFALAGYAGWRMTRRKRKGIIREGGGFVAVSPTSSAVSVEAAQGVFLDAHPAQTEPRDLSDEA